MTIKIGDQIPDFSTIDYKGKQITNETFIGKNVVIFFYPKDDSPVCTTEACSFRDTYADFLNLNCEVIGISGDSNISHKEFAQKHNLQYSLISDKNNELRKKFGVPNSFMGLIPGRVTFLIDKTGKIRLIFNSQLNANKHIEQSMNFLKKYLVN
ncbi:MAG: peroxiredoxin [Bacteroidales bacterium]|nr:peroxiredoxin [Bacteroidales bacterium]